jgi:hypothetical protein
MERNVLGMCIHKNKVMKWGIRYMQYRSDLAGGCNAHHGQVLHDFGGLRRSPPVSKSLKN